MRSLRSTRKAEPTSSKSIKKVTQDENSNAKMCSKRSKPGKSSARNKRPVLADKTNSGSDMNTSTSSICEVSKAVTSSRPKRVLTLPAKYLDHELSPVTRKSTNPDFSSTPLKAAITEKNKTQSKQNLKPNNRPKREICEKKDEKVKNIEKIVLTPVKQAIRSNTIIKKSNISVTPVPKTCAVTNKKSLSSDCAKRVENEKKQEIISINKELSPIKHATRINTRSAISQNKDVQNRNITDSSEHVTCKVVLENNVVTLLNSVVAPSPPKFFKSASKNVTPIYKKNFKLLEKPKIQTPDRLALYEFNFDPNEEPTKPKKKPAKKKAVKRKKAGTGNSNDDAALEDLIQQLKIIQERQKCKQLLLKKKMKQAQQVLPKVTFEMAPPVPKENVPDNRHIENFLSPIPKHTTSRPPSPFEDVPDNETSVHIEETSQSPTSSIRRASFFSDLPAASSSIIQSAHKPAASPWRFDCNTEVRKWPLNFYVKPTMTPSYEPGTVHVFGLDTKNTSAELRKKHVYTNISLSDNLDQDESQNKVTSWKQTSILSFYEESINRAKKKKNLSSKKSVDTFNYDDIVPTSPLPDTSNEDSEEPQKVSESNPLPEVAHEDVERLLKTPEKNPPKNKDNLAIENCFGFDDSEEIDQENISPVKIRKPQNINTIRGGAKNTRRRAGILKEINAPMENIPTRVSTTDIRNMIAKQKDLIQEAVTTPEKEPEKQKIEGVMQDTISTPEKELQEATKQNLSDESNEEITTASMEDTHEPSLESEVGLFEEPIEPDIVHFTKPSRRSYERKRKPQVTFQQIMEDTNKKPEELDYDSDSTMASREKPKKVFKKKKKPNAKAKKEQKEAEQWAASFNSMLEEVDDFALCIE